MSTHKKIPAERTPWEKPELKRLGTIRDIAGRGGAGFQSGPNSRARNS